MNPDLPQFEHGLEGWAEINLAYDLASYIYVTPVAIQVVTGQRRVLTTGILTSTEDQFSAEDKDNSKPLFSMFYFQDAEPLRVNWGDTLAVIAMAAVAVGEETDHGSGSQGEEGDPGFQG